MRQDGMEQRALSAQIGSPFSQDMLHCKAGDLHHAAATPDLRFSRGESILPPAARLDFPACQGQIRFHRHRPPMSADADPVPTISRCGISPSVLIGNPQ